MVIFIFKLLKSLPLLVISLSSTLSDGALPIFLGAKSCWWNDAIVGGKSQVFLVKIHSCGINGINHPQNHQFMVGFHMCSWDPWFPTLHIPWFLFDVEALALRISGLACRHGRNQFQLSSGFLPAGLHGQKMARAEGRALGWGEWVMWFFKAGDWEMATDVIYTYIYM